ncbi:cupin-like domain-containing protein [Brevundimonas sp.]|uniref:cupin-like domain-containing protein n=1 Tax=Brevundimonas sp. TaxID=1871086 RepID=UPI003D0D3A98
MTPIREWRDVTPELFRDIRREGEPAVMRDLVGDWPIVRAARQGEASAYLRALSGDAPVHFMRAAPEVEGRLHYEAGVSGRNFERIDGRMSDFLDALTLEGGKSRPDSLALQGLPTTAHLPEFAQANRLSLLPAEVIPRLWIGNAAKVAIHHDPSENVACVAAGRRRFTLFPPEQVGNLYMGPFHVTPAGTQVSLVHLTDVDHARFPRFARALQAGMQAELAPGDALYIPFHWYHHVEALEPFNVLVNYWWDAAPAGIGSPWDAMMHGMMSLRTLPPDQRRAWRAMFDHYVFQTDGDPSAHLPQEARGILGTPTARSLAQMRQALLERLKGG